MAKNKKRKKVQKPILLSPKKYIRTTARSLPVYKCWVNEGWEEGMMAHIIVSRKHSNGNLTFGEYLVDVLEMGLKDSFAMVNEPVETVMDIIRRGDDDFIEIDYVLAHNLVYGGFDFALEEGIGEDKNFEWSRFILEEDTEEIELIPIPFGGEEEDDGLDELDTARQLLLGYIDLIHLKTFGEYIDEDFSNLREDAHDQVVFNPNAKPPVTQEEHDIIAPYLIQLENIAHADVPDKEELYEMINKINKALDQHPEIPQLYDLLSMAYSNLNDDVQSYHALRDMTEKFPDNYTARFFAGLKFIDFGRLEEAEKLMEGALDVKDLAVGAEGLSEFEVFLFYSMRCHYFMKIKDFEKAEAYYGLIRAIDMADQNFLSEVQKYILWEYAQFRREKLESHYEKPLKDIIEEMGITGEME